jgi:hypothetical protein
MGKVAKNQIILEGLIERGGKAEVHILIVRCVDGGERVTWMAVGEGIVLFLIKQEKADVGTLILGASTWMYE